ncbi:EamA domain-containing protein [Rubrivivax sp. A210]|uniref:DMT family transporter n=1 Tax=Rubrivivax sp. A210 TaxID=2772301 RepID=UPI0019A9AEEC|nr:DMT family transporter [Rubrivivax sp. A210]CAD5373868.1 EamA domain-containing protein [Rubrivivax sp. A210]
MAMRPLPAPLLMVGASLLFALMGVCVKLASSRYGAGEIVLYRSLIGLVLMLALLRWRGIAWRTPVPAMHFWRAASGTTALCLWFYAIGGLPLATAMTLNYLSPVWIALFLIGGATLLGQGGVDGRLVSAVLAGFAGVALILRPTLAQDQLWFGLVGLLSGMLAAVAYLQVSALGRAGEPTERVVLYFSASGTVAGTAIVVATGGGHAHTAGGLALLLAIGALATVAQWMMTAAYARGAALGVAALQYLGILFSFGFGVLIFDDPVTAMSVAGMLLIVAAGVAATLLRGRAPVRRPDNPPTET